MGARSPQFRQPTSRMVPWTSTTRPGSLPAAWWRPSMFWVMRVWSLPWRSRPTSARCPALGSATQAWESSRLRQARFRTSGSAR